MKITHATRDALAPQSPGGSVRGGMLAIGAHVLLVAAIAWGTRWRSAEPEGVVAELWAAVPEIAAPRVEPVPTPAPPPPPVVREPPPPPPPPPREADIATEKPKPPEKNKPEEEPKPPPEKPAPKPAPEPPKPKPEDVQKAERAEQQRLARLREENLKRMMAEAGATGAPSSTGQAARDAGPSATYAGRIRSAVRPNIIVTDTIRGNPKAEVEVRVAPDGTIIGRRIVKPSGQPEWDDVVLRAIDRTGRLPRDVDGRVPGTMILGFSPQD